MLRSSVLPSKESIPPVRSARRQERSFAPGPSPALALRKTPHFRGPRPKSARYEQGKEIREGHDSPHRDFLPARAAQLRVGPVPNINCPGKRASPYLALFLQGKKFNLAAIPPHICREESRQKCSGHPGSGPLARWRRLCQSSFQGIKTIALAAPPRCQPQTAPGSTVRALISPESFD